MDGKSRINYQTRKRWILTLIDFGIELCFRFLTAMEIRLLFQGDHLGAEEPKYLNSPETAIFNKSKILYNFHLAKPSIRKLQHAVFFEGFADVISADRSGVENGLLQWELP